jgi:adenosine/AMP kinase
VRDVSLPNVGKNLTTIATVSILEYAAYLQTVCDLSRCFITITFQLCFGIRHCEGQREQIRAEIEWDTSDLAYADDVN